MKGNSIQLLNKAIADKLSIINQYMYFHFQCDEQGYDLLADLFKETSLEEMAQIEKLAERIKFFRGQIKMTPSGEVVKTHDVKEMLKVACYLENECANEYNNLVIDFFQNADTKSQKLLETFIKEEEKHFSQYQIEIENLKKFGRNYLNL